jgi:16S rRNA pseudouridine516 synthase
VRLDKFIAKSSHLSRTQIRQAIENRRVTVNACIADEESMQVHENNIIELDSVKLTPRPSRYIMFHKSANTECSNVDGVYPSIFNQLSIDHAFDLHVAGRLDADTTGLVLITDDGRWSFNIMTPPNTASPTQCEKSYRVILQRDITAAKIPLMVAAFEKGILLQGESKLTLPAKLKIIKPNEVILTIVEGKFHQVKRMFAAQKNKVIKLHRESIGGITLDVKEGQWRFLNDKEVELFNEPIHEIKT